MKRMLIALSMLTIVACQKQTSTTAPATQPAAPTEAVDQEQNESGGLSGIGHCCKEGECVGKQYRSAHAFAQDCSQMQATEARWCATECELVEQPYACSCPTPDSA